MIPHRGTEITEKNRASVFFAALCGIFGGAVGMVIFRYFILVISV